MALTAIERRQLLIDLVSGRISQEEYNSIMQYQLRRDAQTSQGMAPLPLTEAEKRLMQRANSGRNTTVTPVTSQPEEELTPGGRPLFPGTQLQPDPVPDYQDPMGMYGSDFRQGSAQSQVAGATQNNTVDSSVVSGSGNELYIVVGQPGSYTIRKVDSGNENEVESGMSEQAAQETADSLNAQFVASGGGGSETGDGGATGDPEGFVNSQIWEYNGEKHVVWQVPNTMIFMRYFASDSELDMLYSGRQRPDVVQATDEMWTSSVFFGNVDELDEKVITQGMSPFFGFADNFEKATLGRPWLKTNDEMFALWVEGYVEDRDITTEEWANTDWWNNSTKEERDWLVLSKGRGIGDADFPADAKVTLEQNRILYLEAMKQAGIANADKIRDANGNSLAEWFADKVTFGTFDAVKATEQIEALSDRTSGIQVDERIRTLEEESEKIKKELTKLYNIKNQKNVRNERKNLLAKQYQRD